MSNATIAENHTPTSPFPGGEGQRDLAALVPAGYGMDASVDARLCLAPPSPTLPRRGRESGRKLGVVIEPIVAVGGEGQCFGEAQLHKHLLDPRKLPSPWGRVGDGGSAVKGQRCIAGVVHPSPTPSRKRGGLVYVPGDLQFFKDCQQHAIGVLQDVVVPEPDHAPTVRLDHPRSCFVGKTVSMLPAIKFNREPRQTAGEIDHVVANRQLPRDLKPSNWLARRCAHRRRSASVISRRSLRATPVKRFSTTAVHPSPTRWRFAPASLPLKGSDLDSKARINAQTY